MARFFTSTYPFINIHKKASDKSEIVTQMIYGDSFSVIKKTRKWLKIKIKEDFNPQKTILFIKISSRNTKVDRKIR